MVLTNIFLHGRLGKLYGHEWKLAVKSPAEAIRAINVNTRGRLRAQLEKEGTKKFYKVCLGNVENALDRAGVTSPSGHTDIHIVPVPKGRGSGAAKILAGIALIGIALFVPAVGSGIASLIGGGLTAGAASFGVAMLGASLALGGITQLLTPIPNFNQNSDGDGRGSNLFQGNSVVTTQGSAVGLVYGRMMVTPMPVSVAFNNYDTNASAKEIDSSVEYDTEYDTDTGMPIQKVKP